MKMRRLFLVSLSSLLVLCPCVRAQGVPSAWKGYQSDNYASNIQESYNEKNVGAAEFTGYLADIAVANVARSIKMKVRDMAQIGKKADNGKTSVEYYSSTVFITDVDISLIETRTYYGPADGYGAAIAFIDKAAALDFYLKSLEFAIREGQAVMPSIDRDIGNGLKIKARDDLENALDRLLENRDLFYYLMFFGMDGNRLDVLQEKYNVLAESMKQTLSELDNGLSICIVCNVRSEDGNDFGLCGSVKGEVARIGCNFTDNVSEADWIVTVNAESDDYNCAEFSGFHVYTSHATAEISIMNGATSETVMTDNVSGSGSHTAGYEDATKEAYKGLASSISEIIVKFIK